MTRNHSPIRGLPLRIPGAGGSVHQALRFGEVTGAPLVLHLHGGAFVSAPPAGRTTAVARLLVEAGACVVSLRYPLAPAHPFPQALEAVYACLLYLRRECSAPVVVAGEEAGGNLAAGVARMARDRQEPGLVGQILCSALLCPRLATASQRQARPGTTGSPIEQGWRRYASRPCDDSHPYAAPARALRLEGLAPAWLLTGQDDPFRDETRAYARRLGEHGVEATLVCLPGPTHFPAAYQDEETARAPWMDITRDPLRAFLAAVVRP
jgi:acetyl esterase/lipase